MTLKAAPYSTPSAAPRYLSVSWLSDFTGEEEHLFYGQNVSFQIVNIIESATCKEHKKALALFRKFQRLIQNEQVEWKQTQPEELVIFIEGQKKYELRKEAYLAISGYMRRANIQFLDDERVNQDILQEIFKWYHGLLQQNYSRGLFNYFCRHPNTVTVKINDYKSLNHSILKALLQNKSSLFISVIPLLKLFPYLQNIEMNNIEMSNIEINIYMMDVIMEYIDKIKTLKKRVLKRISFRTKKHHQENQQYFEALQTQFSQQLSKHHWKAEYEVIDDRIDSFTFRNIHEEETKRILEEQRLQQQIEQEEQRRQQQIEQQKQIERQRRLEKQRLRQEKAQKMREERRRNETQISNVNRQSMRKIDKAVKILEDRCSKARVIRLEGPTDPSAGDDMGVIDRIDYKLQKWYQSVNKPYNSNFKKFCEENGMDDHDVVEELEDVDFEDCLFVDFDEDGARKEYIFPLLQQMYRTAPDIKVIKPNAPAPSIVTTACM